MDSRIQLITNLKDCLSSRNSVVQLTHPQLDVGESQAEDIEFIKIKNQIIESNFLKKTNRHVKIRLHKWLDYLDKIKSNKVWIKSRNKYIKLLNLMCYCECLIYPYNGLPPEGQLPTLRKHQINKIIDEVEHFVKNNASILKRQGEVTQNSQIEDNLDRNQSFYSKESYKHKPLQAYYENIPAKDTQSETLPIKTREIATRTNTEESRTLPLSNYIEKKNKNHTEKDQEYTPTFTKAEVTHRKGNYKLSAEKPQRSNITMQEYKSTQKDLKGRKRILPHQSQNKENKEVWKTLALPPKYKCKQPEESKLEKQKITAIPKEYWQSVSNSEVHTPKYLSNYSSQQFEVVDEEVQIVSFRGQKQGESCLCGGAKFGDSWIGQLFNKIIS